MRKNIKKENKILRVLKIPKKSNPSFNPSTSATTAKITAEAAVQTEYPLPSSRFRVMSLSVPNIKIVLFSVLEQQKRRRFHPLRNLRRIFRRRTITSVDDSPAAAAVRSQNEPSSIGSASEKNLRSATLSSISSVVSSPASSPSSPLAHQLLQTLHNTSCKSLPKSKDIKNSHGNMLLAPKAMQQLHQQQLQQQIQNQKQLQTDAEVMYASGASGITATTYHQRQQHVYNMSTVTSHSSANSALLTASSELQPMATTSGHRSSTIGGVAVLPGAFNAALSRSFFAERQKLKSLGDSSQELDSSANSSLGSSSRRVIAGNERNAGHASVNGSGGEMTDSQRSFSEGRLVDSDYSRDGLSQSHDSVFSESATASSLSIVLKAELADALRKRRNRPDASDEDLGLPRSPASPQRRSERSNAAANTTTPTTAGNQSDVSSLSMLSMNSNEGDSMFAETAANAVLHERNYMQVTASRYSRNSTLTSLSSSSDILRSSSTPTKSDTFGEVDLFSSDWQRLSHSAAKHKMAVRPTKKKGPSRQHRRTLETSIPEANEDLFKIGGSHLLDLTEKDAKNKTHSLPPGVNAKKLEQHSEHIFTPMIEVTAEASNSNTKVFDSARANDNKRSKLDNNKADSSEKPSASASSTSFGIRALTAKASSIFELKSESQQSEEREKTEDSKKSSQPAQLIETSESGFLRRLIQRNSKRTIPKATNGEDSADSQSEPKKLQISSSAYDTRESLLSPRLGQSQSAIAYDQQVEQTRKEIKREILSEAGLGAMLNTYLFTNNNDVESPRKSGSLAKDAADALHKPKSGPAARQRYLPQEIPSSSAVDKTKPVALTKLPLLDVVGSNSGGLLSKSSHEESFQSTSIIREITASQSLAATKSEHHLFEKKPKIIGLSAFQQKISRANENNSRSQSQSSSSNSLEVKGEACFLSYEQKQRKSVEKSRSFRTYNSDKDSPTTNVHNNMPSLPDLSLHLPTFNEFILNEKEYSSPSPPERNDKCVSLGFEINDNNLVRPAIRTESANSLNRATSKLSAPTTAILPSLSPTNSCSNDMSEIEQNIDKIVKSPYVSVMRKSATINEEMCSKTTATGTRKLGEAITRGEMRPNSALLAKETKVNEPKVSPSKVPLAVVPMRERTIACILEKPSADMLTRETERKSIGISNPATASKSNACSRPRRSSSVVESSTPETGADTSVPEFLKIQLNRVDPGARALKSTVVLAKNVKETPVVAKDTSERSVSSDDLSLRRYSNESLEIVEHDKPVSPITSEKPVACLFEAINKQTKSLSTNSIQRATTNTELPPKTITIKKHPATPTTQTPPIQTPPTLLSTANANTAGNSSTPTTPTEDVVTLRHKSTLAVEATATTTTTTTTTASSKLSLQERKRLFMNEEKSKADKKIEDLKNERKKSISEELQRKSSSSKSELKESTAEEPAEKEPVIMRKKSFGVVQQTNVLNAATNSNNTNSSTMTNTNCNGSSTTSNREDATPELMKVFARRSLKIKDEDLVHLADKILPATASSTALKKSTAGQSNVDSDKENQSASEEKLDKITKFETISHSSMEQMNSKVLISNAASSISIGSTSITSTRSSLTDFRASATSFKNGGSTKALALNCNNNNNTNSNNNHTNNNSNNNVSNTTTPTSKSSLPSLRVNSGLRTMTVNEQRSVSECMSNNNINNSNNHNNSQNSFNSQTKTSVERQSLCIRTTNVADSGSKTIERSATVGEFKGILQRRAEWEQRAKEALK